LPVFPPTILVMKSSQNSHLMGDGARIMPV